ncbi:MAG: hypothetical protein ACRDXX_00600 [Stackebrandtia sp.]
MDFSNVVVQLVVVTATLLVGVLLGAWTTSHLIARRMRVEADGLLHMTEHSLRVIQDQQRFQVEAARQQRRDAKVEEAYESLSQWLHSLHHAIDQIWEGCCASRDGEETARARHLLDEWPWETLRTPAHIAPLEIYWSSRIWDLIGEFRGASAAFTTRARRELHRREQAIRAGESEPPAMGDVWGECVTMWGLLGKLRDQARREMSRLRDPDEPV